MKDFCQIKSSKVTENWTPTLFEEEIVLYMLISGGNGVDWVFKTAKATTMKKMRAAQPMPGKKDLTREPNYLLYRQKGTDNKSRSGLITSYCSRSYVLFIFLLTSSLRILPRTSSMLVPLINNRIQRKIENNGVCH